MKTRVCESRLNSSFTFRKAIWLAILALLPLIMMTGSATGQDNTGSDVSPEQNGSVSVTESAVTGEQTSTAENNEQVIGGEIFTGEPKQPKIELFSDQDQQVPILRLHGSYYDPSGMTALGPISVETNKSIRARMLKTSMMGFNTFMLRIDWPGIQPEPNRIDNNRVLDLLDYAQSLGLRVIISLELNRAPSWFFKGANGIDRLMVSYLIDPEMEKAVGNDGPLRWANGVGAPIMYHPDTIRAVGKLFYSLYYGLKDHRALLGWYLSGPVTDAFPGGGLEGVVGMCDYSTFSVNRFNLVTETPLAAYPLQRYSQGTRDNRPDFRIFTNERLLWKREAFDKLISTIRTVDKEHLVLVGMDPVLNYRDDNGYLSQIQLADSTRQMIHNGVDGAVIAFRLASDTFEAIPSRTESSAMHLALTINQVLRHGKIAFVCVENDSLNSPGVTDIAQLAQMLKAAGAYPIWSSGLVQKRGHRWSKDQENAIERTQPLSLLPAPKRLRRGQVAIYDLPKFYSSFYAEENSSLKLALLQLAMHQRTGVVLEMYGADEININKPDLEQYRNLIYLTPELTTNQDAKSWIEPGSQIELAAYRALGGVIEAVDPMLLHQYELENYRSTVLEDELRTRYVHRGATADTLHGADAFIIANDPYVFIRINALHGSRYIDVKLAGWPQTNQRYINMVDIADLNHQPIEITSGNASFAYTPVRDDSHLYVLQDSYTPASQLYEDRRGNVAMVQQARNMHKSVPAALLFAALLGVSVIWMTFQSHQKSLLQAAELEDRRRSMEVIDILDDEEVMAFYKTYLSGTDQEPDDANDVKPPDSPDN
jgi:hypothetical protein